MDKVVVAICVALAVWYLARRFRAAVRGDPGGGGCAGCPGCGTGAQQPGGPDCPGTEESLSCSPRGEEDRDGPGNRGRPGES